jgi:hypothetical protein
MIGGRCRLAVAALASGLGVMGGCRAAPLRPPAPALAGAEQALAVLERRDADTRTLTATFEVAVHRADGSAESSRGAVVVERPDRLRLQIFSLGLVTAYDYTVDGDRYRVRRPLDRVEEVGRFDEAPRPARGALGEDLRPLFLRRGRLAEARVEDRGARYRVIVPELAGTREIDVAKQGGRVEHEALYGERGRQVEIDYEDYRPVDGSALPFTIRVVYPVEALSLLIEVERYTRNQPVDPSFFRF